MKKLLLIGLSLSLFACAPVFNRDLMNEAQRNPSLAELRANPDAYKGKVFLLGGTIVDTKFVQNGSQIEALSQRVDSSGKPEETAKGRVRFLAIYPADRGLLDPVVYRKGREITIAGVFLDARKSKIDDMEYTYPVFEIREIHLWEEPRDYYGYPYYPYYSPYWYNPYWAPWPPGPGWWW